MREGKINGMQRVPGYSQLVAAFQASGSLAVVNDISDYRKAEAGHVHPNLMSTAGLQGNSQKGISRPATNYLVV